MILAENLEAPLQPRSLTLCSPCSFVRGAYPEPLGDPTAVSSTQHLPRFVRVLVSFSPLVYPERSRGVTRHPFISSAVERPLSSYRIMFPSKSFRSNTYSPSASVHSKGLTARLSPLAATLTKNRGGGGRYWPALQVFLLPPGIRLRSGCVSCRIAAGVSFDGDVVSLQLAIERGAADSQHFSGESFVSVRLLEDAQNRHSLHFRQCGRGKRSSVRSRHGRGRRLFAADSRRQVSHVDNVSVAERDCARDAILQFPDVARPFVVQQALHGGRGHLNVCTRSVAVEEVVHQHGNIGAALPQGRDVHRH